MSIHVSKNGTISFIFMAESEKVGLQLNIQKTKIMASGPITSPHFLGAPKSLPMVTVAMILKDAYTLEGKLWPT